MRREGAGRWLVILLLGAGPAIVAAEEPPPLSGPSPTPAASSPAGADVSASAPEPATPAASAPAEPVGSRPMLVIPGVNAPGRVRARSAPMPPLEPAGTPGGVESPRLLGPMLAPTPTSLTTPRFAPLPAPSPSPTGAPGRPEPIEIRPDPGSSAAPSRPPARLPAPAPRTTEDRERRVPPRRSPTRFGWLLPNPFSGPREASASAITVEPSSDPAVEAALKRRIERQVHERLGDRVRDVDVRIKGREVAIRARSTRFWQRRAIRRTLESLPGLAGYQATVEILD